MEDATVLNRGDTSMERRMPSKVLLFVVSLVIGMLSIAGQAAASRPNILWLSCEDISPHIGCFGDPFAKTPRIDLPVIALAQNMRVEDLKMIEGTSCMVVEDLASAIYHVVWAL